MYRNFTHPALAGALITLADCATNPSDVRAGGRDHWAQFVVQTGYLDAHRGILGRQRACEQANLISAQWVVQCEVYPDTKSGTITDALHGALGIQTDTAIDIKAINDGSTDVIVSSKQNAARYAARIQKWLSGVQEARNCWSQGIWDMGN